LLSKKGTNIMETGTSKKVRIFRDKQAILQLLEECKKSNLSVKQFCAAKGIAQGSFHNWKKKYDGNPSEPDLPRGFTRLQINPASTLIHPGLFAEVGSIKIYQPVAAAYLRELLS
jgi:hypothetical protein